MSYQYYLDHIYQPCEILHLTLKLPSKNVPNSKVNVERQKDFQIMNLDVEQMSNNHYGPTDTLYTQSVCRQN